MGCNCKKNKRQPLVITTEPPQPIPVPEIPTMVITERPTTQEELNQIEDFYNNIDTIEPIKTEGE